MTRWMESVMRNTCEVSGGGRAWARAREGTTAAMALGGAGRVLGEESVRVLRLGKGGVARREQRWARILLVQGVCLQEAAAGKAQQNEWKCMHARAAKRLAAAPK